LIRRILLPFVACVLTVAACKSEDVHVVQIKFAETRVGGLQRGFWCREAADQPFLLERLAATNRVGSMVVDFIKLGGLPSCRPAQLQDWCESHDCAPVRQKRSCLPLTPPDSGKTRILSNPVDALLAELAGTVVAKNVPDEYVMVRVVMTTQTCDQIGDQPFDAGKLVGCAHSCPALLTDYDGDVLLDLDVRDDNCEIAVAECAGLTAADVSAKAR
jgi:hypothetical protein